jgi:hypothetical protein
MGVGDAEPGSVTDRVVVAFVVCDRAAIGAAGKRQAVIADDLGFPSPKLRTCRLRGDVPISTSL